MKKRYSIADARNQLARLVHEAEDGELIELTRRGKPVAVVMSLEAWRRATEALPSPWQAIANWREASGGVEVPEDFGERPREPGHGSPPSVGLGGART